MTGDAPLDLLLIHPGSRDAIYQELGDELTAIEPPLWCGLIATYCRLRGHRVAIIDGEAEGWGPDTIADRVAGLRPRLVGLVVYGHQPSASTQSMPAAGAVCRAIKDRDPHQPVIIVGGHVAALPERTLDEEAVDFVCTGEGPVTVEALLRALAPPGGEQENPAHSPPAPADAPANAPAANALAAVPGLLYRTAGGTPVRTPPAPLIEDLDRDLPGSSWDLLPMDRYRAHNWQCFGDLSRRRPYASIYTTLGCPYRCSFCCINAPFGKSGYRFRSPEAVLREIDILIENYAVRTFKIVDEMFVLNERHVGAICDGLILRNERLGGELNLWAYARVDTVKPRILDRLRRAGVRWLALGIESGSKHVRDGALKALKNEDIVGIVRTIQQAGINVIGNYIFGLPDDTAETMQATLDLASELNCEFANFYSAMAYPGSPLYAEAVASGWALPASWSGYSQHSVDCTPLPTRALGAAEVLAFRDRAFHSYFTNPRYLKMVDQRFGGQTSAHIRQMTGHRLRRMLLEEQGRV
jgi:radical SAM superfamily enzyme YgiQ (UPF0313 family)